MCVVCVFYVHADAPCPSLPSGRGITITFAERSDEICKVEKYKLARGVTRRVCSPKAYKIFVEISLKRIRRRHRYEFVLSTKNTVTPIPKWP